MKDISTRTIDWVRFPLVLLVLVVHCHAEEFPYLVPISDLAGHSVGEIFYSIFAIAGSWIGNVAVPLFFMLSGYLFFFNAGEQWSWDFYQKKLKKRVRTLLIPYILFNLICLVSVLIVGEPGWRNPDMVPVVGYFWNSTSFCAGMTNWFGLDMQLYYPELIPLWFVRDLIFMCIISPAVWYLLKRFPKCTLFILTVIYLSGLWIGACGYSSPALLFFTLGAYFALRGKDIVEFSYQHVWKFTGVTLVLWVIVTAWNSLTDAQQFNHALNLVGAFATLGLTALWTDKSGKKVWPLFPKSSFFVYAFHMCAIGTFSVLNFCPACSSYLFGTPDNFVSAFVEACLNPFLVAAFCLAVYVALQKICPPLLSLLTGGR